MRSVSRHRLMALVNGALALLLTFAAVWLLHAAQLAAEEEVRVYGHNTDSGAIQSMVALGYCAPAALVFGLASAVFWLRWRIRWLLQLAALGWAGFVIASLCTPIPPRLYYPAISLLTIALGLAFLVQVAGDCMWIIVRSRWPRG